MFTLQPCHGHILVAPDKSILRLLFQNSRSFSIPLPPAVTRKLQLLLSPIRHQAKTSGNSHAVWNSVILLGHLDCTIPAMQRKVVLNVCFSNQFSCRKRGRLEDVLLQPIHMQWGIHVLLYPVQVYRTSPNSLHQIGTIPLAASVMLSGIQACMHSNILSCRPTGIVRHQLSLVCHTGY